MNLSIVILTFNSQKYLDEVLKSAKFADEIIIVDNGSTDKTEEIAKRFLNTKFHHQKWLGFGKQKQAGVNLAKNSWVFVLDSDEVITKNLENEIIKTIQFGNFVAYKVARENIFFGKKIKTMGLYPDYSIRLFNKNHACFNEREIHEKIILKDKNLKVGALKNPFIHYAYESIEQFISKQNRYSSLGKKQNKIKALINPTWTFFKLFVLKGGFRDGFDGYKIAKLYSQYTFWKYIK